MRLLHYAKRPVERAYPAVQKKEPDPKPEGLWVSVEGEDDWLSWCRSENFALDRLAHVHEVVLSSEATVLVLDSVWAIDKLTADFGIRDMWWEGQGEERFYRIDWSRVAELWQGIVIAPYQWSRRLEGRTSWYYSWDCASGCIWNAAAVKEIRELATADAGADT